MDFASYLRFAFVLGLVLLLIAGCAWLARRFGLGGVVRAGGRGQRLSLREVRPLDPRHKLVLLQCDGQEYLVLLGPAAPLLLDSRPAVEARPPLPSAGSAPPEQTGLR